MNEKKQQLMHDFAQFARIVSAEGIVLLKNENNMLPIKSGEEVAVFGRCQIDYYRSGTGSGGSVNVPYRVNALEGLRKNETIAINEELASIYETFVQENPFDNGGGGWAAEPWFQKEMPITDDVIQIAKKTSVKAMVIIGRTAGEEQDNKDTQGGYRLNYTEIQMLEMVTASFEKVAVVLNVANIIDMSWLDALTHKEHILSVLYSWQGGMEGGNGLADVLSGEVTPSGKLTDTIAYNIEDYPSHTNFEGELENFYQEDIYLGYRYFETFAKSVVRYPFGFGLSYTEFSLHSITGRTEGQGKETTFIVDVTVQNCGANYSGKEIVQIYYEAPQGELGKPLRQLGGFAKTGLLAPGQTQQLSISIPIARMASYDDGGYTGNKSCYVLEAGDYRLFAGNSVRSLENVVINTKPTYTLDSLIVVEKLSVVMCPTKEFKRIKPGHMNEDGEFDITYESVPVHSHTEQADLMRERMARHMPLACEITGDQNIKLIDVKNKKYTLEAFIAQLSQEDLEVIVRGEGMSSPKVTSGTASAFGGLSESLLRFGIPVACAADGPSGIRMDSGETATQLPIGTLLASTWNTQLIEEVYVLEGQELLLNEIDTLLGPGMNIHRHPLNGRNFEYFSEDPFLTGCMAKAVTLGLKKGGSTGTIKHFVANDQEHNRRVVDSIMSERALREIHLKGFEIVVKEGSASSLMTAYNPINGIFAASNYDLNTTVLRGEWGYTGVVMTDWWATMNDPVYGGAASLKDTSSMVRSQNDVFMVVNNFGAEANGLDDNLTESLSTGVLTIGELQRCAMNICKFILDAPAMERPIKTSEVNFFAAVQQALPEVITYPVGIDFTASTNVDKTLWIEVDSEGYYNLLLTMKNDQWDSAQASFNILLNDKFVANIQLNGTMGRWVKQKNICVHLETGFYKMDIVITKAGIDIGTLKFIK